ncbi:MAG: glycerophosphodiester phosphodiesterase [Trueperaceae bacterium]
MDESLAWALAVATFVALIGWRFALWRPRPLPGVDRPGPWAMGHRGVRGSLPENTVAAFEAALAAGLDGLEVDVQRTRDGHLVLTHDFELGGQRVVDADLATLRAAAPELPTFDELVAVARRYPGTLLNVELKSLGWRDRGLPAAVAEALRASDLADRTIVSSFSPVALARFRLRAPEVRTGYLWTARSDAPLGLRSPWPAGWLHVDALHPHHSSVTADAVARWHRRGALVSTWTVNDPADASRVRAAGVDGIIGDDPRTLLDALDRAPEPRVPEEDA